MKCLFPEDSKGLLRYEVAEGVEAFSTLREAALPYPVLQGHQTHGTNVVVVRDRGLTREDLEGVDALVTDMPGFAIGVRTADCVPVLLYDPVCRVVAAVHSGWKGTVAKIVSKAIEVMGEEFGCRASSLLAVIGPSISLESFQVGEEVAARFLAAGFPSSVVVDDGPISAPCFTSGSSLSSSMLGPTAPHKSMAGGLHIDLWAANRWLLESAGVLSSNILVAGIDTYSRNDLFFSARREGISCGRIINSIRLVP